MTTPTERAAREIYDVLSGQYGDFNMPDDAAQALADAGLLVAPVDGELREALALTLDRHGWDLTEEKCLCGDALDDDNGMDRHLSDALLPTVAAHVAEEKRKAAEQAWDEGYDRGFYDREQLTGESRDASEGRSQNPYELGGE